MGKDHALYENLLIFLLVIVCFGIGLGPVIWNHYQRGRILKNGVSAQARILDVRDTGRRHNRNPVVEIKLMVTDATGREFPGLVKMPVSPVYMTRYPIGNRVKVKYMPAAPARMAIDHENENGST
jgi:hypothetical protein